MPAYHIAGSSGAGKSTVGKVLQQRGYRIVETDHEPGLSGWFENSSGRPVKHLPPQPFPADWLAAHSWLWQPRAFRRLAGSAGKKPLFLCGGAYNERDFYDCFEQRFGLWVDDATLEARLGQREPERWRHDSVELANMLVWNRQFRDYCASTGAVVIDGSLAPDEVALAILGHL